MGWEPLFCRIPGNVVSQLWVVGYRDGLFAAKLLKMCSCWLKSADKLIIKTLVLRTVFQRTPY